MTPFACLIIEYYVRLRVTIVVARSPGPGEPLRVGARAPAAGAVNPIRLHVQVVIFRVGVLGMVGGHHCGAVRWSGKFRAGAALALPLRRRLSG